MRLGVEAMGGSPADFVRLIKSDSERLLRVLRDASIQLDGEQLLGEELAIVGSTRRTSMHLKRGLVRPKHVPRK